MFRSVLAVGVVLLGASIVLPLERLSAELRSTTSRTNELTASKNVDLQYSPRRLSSGTVITLATPLRWQELGERLLRILDETDQRFQALFGEYKQVETTLKLMDGEEFYESTNAPQWTNAMFFRGQIIIPLDKNNSSDFENLERSVRHEFTHAVIHSLSGGKCPGWLDEGIAQWVEGKENPALRPALAKWLSHNPPVPFSLLQGGFTRLSGEMVPAAYAQSLFSARTLLSQKGFPKFRRYLSLLKAGISKDVAFPTVFGMSEHQLESRLNAGRKRPEFIRAMHSESPATLPDVLASYNQ
jgi:hypothetical protein